MKLNAGHPDEILLNHTQQEVLHQHDLVTIGTVTLRVHMEAGA